MKMNILVTLISDQSIVLTGSQKPRSFSLEMPCRAHTALWGAGAWTGSTYQEDQIWHPFLRTMFCGSVLRKHGHECVCQDLFSAWLNTQARQ